MQERFKISVQRSCRLSLLQPSVWYAKSQARNQNGLRLRIREIAWLGRASAICAFT